MASFPTLFISHGSPNLALHDSPAREFFKGFGEKLGRPQAILIASSQFDMKQPSFCADEKPGMYYDFEGFEEELYKVDYPAPGLPQLATIAANLVEQSGLPAQEIIGRGFDHGVFVPLSLLYPEADIPVVQMAIQAEQGAGHHIVLGQALAPLRQHGILIIGSGSLTHNANEVYQPENDFSSPAQDFVQAFADWVKEKAEAGSLDDIADYKALGPHALENHPKPDHFMPFAFALGAAGEGAKGKRVHTSVQRGVVMMDSYIFE
jgi:4,5-DOPA dioxygenase extradiol